MLERHGYDVVCILHTPTAELLWYGLLNKLWPDWINRIIFCSNDKQFVRWSWKLLPTSDVNNKPRFTARCFLPNAFAMTAGMRVKFPVKVKKMALTQTKNMGSPPYSQAGRVACSAIRPAQRHIMVVCGSIKGRVFVTWWSIRMFGFYCLSQGTVDIRQLFLAATKQLYKWYFSSVCLSVRLSVRLSVTPFWLCSHHRIIMKFSGVITSDRSDVRAKGQGQRSKVKVTEVTTQLYRFRTVTPVWIHVWWWNDAYSLLMLRRGALLFFKVICQISRSHSSKNRRIWPRLGVSGL